MNQKTPVYDARLMQQGDCLSLAEICRFSDLDAEQVFQMIDYGIIEPSNERSEPLQTRWKFEVSALPRVKAARRLQTDLQINLAGTALALELLDEIRRLKERLRYLDCRG